MKSLQNIFLVFIGACLLTFSCSLTDMEYAEIKDTNLLSYLIDQGFDKNADGRISDREAGQVRSIEIWPADIKDLSGLEFFTSLDTMIVQMNPLDSVVFEGLTNLRYLSLHGCEVTSLDVQNLKSLEYLECSGSLAMTSNLRSLDIRKNRSLHTLICSENQIEELDVSENISLERLSCDYNLLEDLDVSSNINLQSLTCKRNMLSTIDVAINTKLIKLVTCGNQMGDLDISTNINLQILGIDNMPMLTSVYVWTLPFPPADFHIIYSNSPHVVFKLKN